MNLHQGNSNVLRVPAGWRTRKVTAHPDYKLQNTSTLSSAGSGKAWDSWAVAFACKEFEDWLQSSDFQ